jgi:hypothetical protein
VTAKKGIFSHDTYPAFLRSTKPLDAERNGCSKKNRNRHGRPLAEKSQTRRTKNRWPHQTLSVEKSQGCSFISRYTRRRKLRLGSRPSCRMLPFPNTRAVICNAASCAGVRSAEPPAHESPPSPRVPRVRRPGSSNITASCVGGGDCAVMGVAVLTLALGQRNAHASLSASVPPAALPAHRKKVGG